MNGSGNLKGKIFLEKMLKNPAERKCAVQIFLKLTSQYTTGEMSKIRKKIMENPLKLEEGIEFLKDKALNDKEFSAAIIPTIVSSGRARSFLFSNEKEPSEDEIYLWLYWTLSSLYSGNNLMNLVNVDEQGKRIFKEELMSHEILIANSRGIDLKRLYKECPVPISAGEHTFAFSILNYFLFWCKKRLMEEKIEKAKIPDFLELYISRWKISDDAGLMVFYVPARKKSRLHFFPGLRSLIRNWYADYLREPDVKPPYLGRFMASLYISDRDQRIKSAALVNKLAYSLLRGEVAGDILEKNVLLKVEHILSKDHAYGGGIFNAKAFFRNLSLTKLREI